MSVNNVSNTSTAAYTSNVYQNNYRYDANTSKTDDKDKDKNQGVVMLSIGYIRIFQVYAFVSTPAQSSNLSMTAS